MARTTVYNDFHNTEAIINPIFDKETADEYEGKPLHKLILSPVQVQSMKKRLCGMNCDCSGVTGIRGNRLDNKGHACRIIDIDESPDKYVTIYFVYL